MINYSNEKYHLHVQHSAGTKTQGNCIKDKKSNKGIRVKYLKKCITLTTSTKLQSMGTKQYIEYKITLSHNTKSFK